MSPPADPHAPDDTPARLPSARRLVVLTLLVAASFAALGMAGMRARSHQQDARDAVAEARSGRPRVLVATAEKAPGQVDQLLPATAVPLLETAVYARTSGYLKRWLVDIGATVAEGQLLAEIETPEVDAGLLQARAAVAEAKATLARNEASEALARVNLDRLKRLTKNNAVSDQEYDAAAAAHQVAAATVQVSGAAIQASEANVRRLEELQKFQRVVAPFSGVITARNFDPGALIVADNAAARELFHLARIDTLRVIADVPQTFATAVHAGQPATVSRREAPGREYGGTVARSTRSLDPLTRTLKVEVEVPNPDATLLPGMYLQVRFRLDAPADVVRVPGAAVIARGDGVRVATVDPRGEVRYRPVQLGRDFGTMVEVVGGLAGGERLVVRPGDDLPEGSAVEVVTGGS